MEKINFIKLPIELHNHKRKSPKNLDECKECAAKAERTGMTMKQLCPDLDCSEPESDLAEDFEIVATHDYIRPEDIKSFLPIAKDSVHVSFYDGTVFIYSMTEKAFLKKVEKFITIL